MAIESCRLLEKVVHEIREGVDIVVVVSRDAARAGKLVVLGGDLVYYVDPDLPEGMVNGELARVFSRILRVPSSRVDVVYGAHGSSVKRLRVRGVSKERVIELLCENVEQSG